MTKKYILAFDQGTTSSRTAIINADGSIKGIYQEEFSQLFPKPGWVEHNPLEIVKVQISTFKKAITQNKIELAEIAGIGIANQRETTVVWNKHTGKPIYNAIVWQDKRTVDICENLKKKGLNEYVKKTTGLVIDSFFSATKINWILNNIPGAKEEAEKGNLLFGTIDTWLLWNFTKGEVHATDYSNASRTMLFDIVNLRWDRTLLKALEIPESMLPQVQPSSGYFGDFIIEKYKIPITGIAGDQQAALFGQACFKKGEVKNTYGTGCFMLLNTGEEVKYSKNGLLSTIAWGIDNKVYYALEGSVFVAGAAIQWLKDGLQIIKEAKDSEYCSNQVEGENPVYVVPAFAGLGAPYWDMYARGAIFGLTFNTGKNHLVKATLNSLAYQTKDVLNAMQKDSKIKLKILRVDGGVCANDLLMQFQSDILNIKVEKPKIIESTIMGAGYLAGIYVGMWKQGSIHEKRKISKVFLPNISQEKREKLYKKWKEAVKRTKNWIN
ncbi:MAG: glycerol kinase GlpK [Tenacibaculum sp.]